MKPSCGRKALIPDEKIAESVELTTKSTPAGHTRWSCRTMAKKVGVSPATVQRIWSSLGLQPRWIDTFKAATARGSPKSSSTWLPPPQPARTTPGAGRSVVACTSKPTLIRLLNTGPSYACGAKGRSLGDHVYA